MTVYQTIPQTIASSYQNVSLRVPAIVDGVSCSFQKSNDENGLKTNNTELFHVPNITSLQFLFNDSTNTYQTYQMTDQVEVLNRYLESFNADTSYNAVSMSNVKNNRAFGVGIDMPNVDLSRQKLNVQMQSGVQSTNPLTMYMYFKSKVVV